MTRKTVWSVLLLLLFLSGVHALAEGTHTPPAAELTETVYAIDQEHQTYHAVPPGDWERVRSALTLPSQPRAEDTSAKDRGGFCFVLKSGERIIYTVTDSQVLAGNAPLMASIFQRQALEQLSAALCAANPAQPAMLAYMNPEHVTKLTVKGIGQTGGRTDPEKPLDFSVTAAANQKQVRRAADAVKRFEVKPRAADFVSWTPAPDADGGTLYLALDFTTGTRYDMTVAQDSLLIRSSDGVRTYQYYFEGNGPLREMREMLWEEYAGGASCVTAGVFLTRTDTRERQAGAFYSIREGGELPLARLSHVADNILAAKPLPTVTPAGKTFVELYAELRSGELKRFELDETLNAYYLNSAGRGVSVSISREDWDTVRSMLNGEDSTEKLMLTEKGETRRLMSLTGSEWYAAPLFQPLPKDPDYKPYNTGPKPDYAANGVHCWAVRDGVLTETTVYPAVLVQQSNMLPWTPAEYDAAQLYRLLDAD